MNKFIKNLICLIFIFFLSCSSQKLVVKEVGYSIKFEKGDITWLRLKNGQIYDFKNTSDYKYIMNENSVTISKNSEIIAEIDFSKIEAYNVVEKDPVDNKEEGHNKTVSFLSGSLFGIILVPLIIVAGIFIAVALAK